MKFDNVFGRFLKENELFAHVPADTAVYGRIGTEEVMVLYCENCNSFVVRLDCGVLESVQTYDSTVDFDFIYQAEKLNPMSFEEYHYSLN